MALELTAEFGPYSSKHISKYGKPDKGETSCLSFSTDDNVIVIMAEKFTIILWKKRILQNTFLQV
jgi:hypothetical protein